MGKTAVLGIDVGGTKVGVGLVTREGEIIDSLRYPQRYCPIGEWTLELAEKVQGLLDKNRTGVSVEAVGIGSRGHIDFKNQRLLSTTIMDVTAGYDLCGELKGRFGYPVYIDNDVKAAACGEILFGAGRQSNNFVCYNVGTGIAVSVVAEGRLVRGRQNDAGEIGGDILWRPEGKEMFKGLERLASGKGLETEAGEGLGRYPESMPSRFGGEITVKKLFEACRDGDAMAEEVVGRALYVLAASVVNIRHLLDPELFVFVGGVVSDQWFFGRLKDKVKEMAEMTGEEWDVRLQVSEPGIKEIGLLGAASVAFYNRETKQFQ